MQLIKRQNKEYEQKIEHARFIREEYRPGIGTVVMFQEADGEITEHVVKPHPDYIRSSKLIDAILERNSAEIQRSKRQYKHIVIDKENLIRYVA